MYFYGLYMTFAFIKINSNIKLGILIKIPNESIMPQKLSIFDDFSLKKVKKYQIL